MASGIRTKFIKDYFSRTIYKKRRNNIEKGYKSDR